MVLGSLLLRLSLLTGASFQNNVLFDQNGEVTVKEKIGLTKGKRSLYLPTPPSFVYVLGPSGIGSQILGLFGQAIFFEEQQNRSIIIDEVTYPYRYNESVGLFTAYFTPQFPVIDSIEQQREWIEPLFTNGHNYTEWRTREQNLKWDEGDTKHNTAPPPPVMVTSFLSRFRYRLMVLYNTSSVEFYRKMVEKTCPHVQFNADTQRRMKQLKKKHKLPDFSSASSAAFHIRHGDKLRKESKKYAAADYVKKLMQVAPGRAFDNCFVASDSFDAVTELREALAAQNWTTCRQLSTLTQPVQTGFSLGENEHFTDIATLQFLTELQILVQAEWFVGTFNSNVGGLATVLRSCGGRYNFDEYPYARSFGVDEDHWYFR
jgi:hypothetical protein